jgi:hypothetical protein
MRYSRQIPTFMLCCGVWFVLCFTFFVSLLQRSPTQSPYRDNRGFALSRFGFFYRI